MAAASFHSRLRTIGAFLYLWLMVGFALGTVVLVGATRWLTEAMREAGWSEARESRIMIAVIVAYVITSLLATWLLHRWRSLPGAGARRWAIPVVATGAAALCLWGWMTPGAFADVAGGGKIERIETGSGATFIFGAYPDIHRLRELMGEERITGVISLQHPAVVPFEPEGIAHSREATAELGLEFVHAPMLPWVSDNEASLEKIREVVRRGEGRYYVHCGLGRDRTNVVRGMIERMGGEVEPGEMPEARTWAHRRADGRGPLERGDFQEVAPDVWLIPYPNEHEMYGNMLAGQVAHVLLLLDPADSIQAGWIEEARRQFTTHEVTFSLEPLRPGEDERALELARRALELPRPVTVVAPFTPPKEGAEVARGFLRAMERARAETQER